MKALESFVAEKTNKDISDFKRIGGGFYADVYLFEFDKKNCKVTAIIDPCGCMWADSEYDLYQLNNANGKHLKLFEAYAKKKNLSGNCFQKMAFYELFTEIEHYYNSGYPVQQKLIKKQAEKLKKYLSK